MNWTVEQVLSLAPDSSSAAAGRGLAKPSQWTGLGQDTRVVWGLCQGSGANPYQVRVALDGPAFKCSCPSRKFPCKHGLALLLLAAQGAVKEAAEVPAWVSDWLATRGEKAERAAAKAVARESDPEQEAARARQAAARSERREERVLEGLEACKRWCEDLVRTGLAGARGSSGAERVAARLVDAQAPGVARAVERLGEALATGAGELGAAAQALGKLHLLLEAGARLPSLPEDLAGDVRVALGWPQTREQALTGEALEDRWVVLGRGNEELDRGVQERTWLVGERSGRRALLVDFHPGGHREGNVARLVGISFESKLHFHPSRLALRALEAEASGTGRVSGVAWTAWADASVELALERVADELAKLPWLERHLVLLHDVRIVRDGEVWLAVDASGRALPLASPITLQLGLALLLLAEDQPLAIAAEFDGNSLVLLSAWRTGAQERWFDCVELGADLRRLQDEARRV